MLASKIGMNLNSLIIVADAARARLFRTVQTDLAEEPIELIEVDAVDPARAGAGHAPDEGPSVRRAIDANARSWRHVDGSGDDALRGFARQVAECAARYAHSHFCNSVVVAAPGSVYSAIQIEIARELPHANTRSVSGDLAQLPLRELLHVLQERGAFIEERQTQLA